MSNDAKSREDALAELDKVLDILGSDMGRWPESLRLRLEPFIATDADAHRRLASARALDRLLDSAAMASAADRNSLAEQIVAAAAAEARAVSEVQPGTEEPQSREGSATPDGARPPRSATVIPLAAKRPSSPMRSTWQAAALAAACLGVGLVSGANGLLVDWVAPWMPAELADRAPGDDLTEIVFSEDSEDWLEEEM